MFVKMAGWCSDSESVDEPLNLHLFARKSFAFQGFSEEKCKTLKKIVTQLGATCDEFPKHIFTTEEYFKQLEETVNTLYNVTYIRDCVDANRCLTIEPYRFGPKYVEKKEFRDFEPCCRNFHNGQESCIICDPTFKPEIPAKQKRKVRPKPTEPIENKISSKSGLLKDSDSALGAESVRRKKKSSWEPWESRLLLDYIIVNKLYFMVKSPSLYKRISAEGFLKHRTPESMRVHFRKNILRQIESYDIPKPILNKLKQIRSTSFKSPMKKKFLKKKQQMRTELL